MLEDADKLIKILEGQLSNKKELEKENKQLKESNRILRFVVSFWYHAGGKRSRW